MDHWVWNFKSSLHIYSLDGVTVEFFSNLSLYYSVYARLKEAVFRFLLKQCYDNSGFRSDCGREFHTVGPATLNALEPIFVRVRGTQSSNLAAERRCWRPDTAATGLQQDVKYDIPIRIHNTNRNITNK